MRNLAEVSIICVNWNSVGYLRDCIASIYEHAPELSFEIIVVDNASPVKDVDLLKQHFPDITLIKSDRNLGFAGANNLAYEHSSGRHLLFLNPDTQLTGPAIQTMMSHLNTLPDAGLIGCKLLNTDLSVQTSCIQQYPTILNQIVDIEYIRLRWPKCRLWSIDPLFSESPIPVKVEVISGACMMVKREIFEQVGRFSEEYFMYAEDIDLSYAVARAGFSNYYIGDAVVIHHGGRSSAQRSVSQWATIMKFRAMTRFCRKTRGSAYGFGFRLAMGCAAVGRLGILAVTRPLRFKFIDYAGAQAKWGAILKWAVGLDHAMANRNS